MPPPISPTLPPGAIRTLVDKEELPRAAAMKAARGLACRPLAMTGLFLDGGAVLPTIVVSAVVNVGALVVAVRTMLSGGCACRASGRRRRCCWPREEAVLWRLSS